jgi:hypothetical protein
VRQLLLQSVDLLLVGSSVERVLLVVAVFLVVSVLVQGLLLVLVLVLLAGEIVLQSRDRSVSVVTSLLHVLGVLLTQVLKRRVVVRVAFLRVRSVALLLIEVQLCKAAHFFSVAGSCVLSVVCELLGSLLALAIPLVQLHSVRTLGLLHQVSVLGLGLL